MSGHPQGFLTKLESFFSRGEWTIRLLKLGRLQGATSESGLVMVQIDGLSMAQLNQALQKNHLPFLKSLLSQKHYMLRSLYSGLPSNTPAVQAEIFYGVKGCVPAFHFLDRKTQQAVKMFDISYVEGFEKRLMKKGPGLLAGGSAYSDVFTGAAKEAHFCFSCMGWEGVRRAIHPLVFPFLLLLYADIFVSIFVLMVMEFFMALWECLRGTLSGRLFFRELELVWQRAVICIFLREFITAGACIDVLRGMPVIHLNFLGYDEQAHGRGPSSRFAHWSLEGIDDSIRRIDRCLKRSFLRHYSLWVYSDHGQAKTTPYFVKYGRTIEEAVQELFDKTVVQSHNSLKTRRESTHSRAALLNKEKKSSKRDVPLTPDAGPSVIVTAMGPLGHIYTNKSLQEESLHFYASQLVSKTKIPLVLTKEGPKVLAWTPRGCFIFPEEADKVFGVDHPFLEDMKEDLLRVCFHPDAGEFVIAGWSQGQEAISFPLEYGAHASMTPEETQAFALLPLNAPVEIEHNKNYLRPIDLRHAAQHFLHKETWASLNMLGAVSVKPLVLMSYNVHGCAGMDGHISTDRIAEVIDRHHPDIISVQEVDVGRLRSGRTDQTEIIARKLEMEYHFHPAFRWRDEQYGNAILSRYPMALIKSGSLPTLADKRRKSEPRGALWVTVEYEGKKIQVINTHLSLWPKERLLQAEALLSEEWLKHPDCRGPVIVCGDFNARPRSAVHRKFTAMLYDTQIAMAGHRPLSTWSGQYPISRIDYIFVNDSFQVRAVAVPRGELEKIASDHLPLVTELKFAHQGAERRVERSQ